jgi:hypothetical protein
MERVAEDREHIPVRYALRREIVRVLNASHDVSA